jgi:hypothetical protein
MKEASMAVQSPKLNYLFPTRSLSFEQPSAEKAKINFQVFISPQPDSWKRKMTQTITPQVGQSFEALLNTFLQPKEKMAEPPLLTSGATSTEDVIANISYFIRTLLPDSVPSESVGITTGENIFQGSWAAYKALERFKQAREVSDDGGVYEGMFDVFRGVNQSVGGANYLAYRVLNVIAQIKRLDTSAQATSAIGKATFFLGSIGNVFFGIFYMMLGIWGGYQWIKDWQFSAKLHAHEADAFDFLVRKASNDPLARLQQLQTEWDQLPPEKKADRIGNFKRGMQERALAKLTDLFCSWQKDNRSSQITPEQAKEAFKVLFSQLEGALVEKGIDRLFWSKLGRESRDLSLLELIGFLLQEEERARRHEAKFSRVVNAESVQTIKKAAERGLKERLGDTDSFVCSAAQKELAELKGRVVQENRKNQWIHAATVGIAALGIAASVLACFSLPPVGAGVLVGITLLLAGVMMVTDSYAMIQGWNSGKQPGRYDKTYVLVVSAVIVGALAVSVGLTFGFGLPVTPLILAGVIAVLALGMSGTTYYFLSKKEKKWKEEHLDLSAFQECLRGCAQDEVNSEVANLFKKLPKTDRQAIRAKYRELSPQLRFRQQKLQLLDQNGDFGAAYLQQLISGQPVEDATFQQLNRAVKKTVKVFWEQAAVTRSEIDRMRALKMQGLLERIRQKDLQAISQHLAQIRGDASAYEQLKNDLWFVIKRDESLQDLKRAVDEVLNDRLHLSSAEVPKISTQDTFRWVQNNILPAR